MDIPLDLASAIYHGADMSDAEKAAKLYAFIQRRETEYARSMELARAHIRHHVDADERVKDYDTAIAAMHRVLDGAGIAPADCGDSQCIGSVVKRVRALVADDARLRDRVGGLLNEVEKTENRAQDIELELMKFQNTTQRQVAELHSNLKKLANANHNLFLLIREAQTNNIALRIALKRYTDATIVSSWGYQELEDIGGFARDALARPAPGAALLRELEAARVIVGKVHAMRQAGETLPSSMFDALNAYDALRAEREATQ